MIQFKYYSLDGKRIRGPTLQIETEVLLSLARLNLADKNITVHVAEPRDEKAFPLRKPINDPNVLNVFFNFFPSYNQTNPRYNTDYFDRQLRADSIILQPKDINYHGRNLGLKFIDGGRFNSSSLDYVASIFGHSVFICQSMIYRDHLDKIFKEIFLEGIAATGEEANLSSLISIDEEFGKQERLALASTRQSIIATEATLSTLYIKYEQQETLVKALNARDDLKMAAVKEKLEALRNSPFVEKVTVKRGRLFVRINPLKAIPSLYVDNRERFPVIDIGALTLQVSRDNYYYVNATKLARGWSGYSMPHPHLITTGYDSDENDRRTNSWRACLGNFEVEVRNMLHANNLFEAVYALIEFLRMYNPDDSAGALYGAWT